MVIKEFPDVPIGHRQHMHTGHCQFIHGHSLKIRLAFNCHKLDKRGFVIDFGAMDYPKELIKSLDHAMLISMFDLQLAPKVMRNDAAFAGLFKPIILPTPSIEGVAWWINRAVTSWLNKASDRRVYLEWVEITEDSRNTIRCGDADVVTFQNWLYNEFPQAVATLNEFLDNFDTSASAFIGDRGAYLNG